MSKRAVAAVLWFAASWVAYELLWSVSGVPRMIGPIVAAGVSAFVALDPQRLFWPAPGPANRAPAHVGATPASF
jgi:hypothetical protein